MPGGKGIRKRFTYSARALPLPSEGKNASREALLSVRIYQAELVKICMTFFIANY